ncbi:ATP-binding protein [Cereibacter azotoformans]|uniref:sensor histidine kinase n=1 Tax=Cereibacter azotoformans TaxID=43057 RepID=UPI000E35926B|nr:ATP-binding protein [Cereibacter azotoformans]AXQ95397.1 PAS domain-containing sensor histidine kinase [Cereibacter sphaeroides]UIJ32372.1 ATP-binding protein [Cereibacter azotoformans]
MGNETQPREGDLPDSVWMDVLSAVDRTYADLVDYQERLERQNDELERLRSFHASVLASVSDILIVVSRAGEVEEASASVSLRTRLARSQLCARRAEDLFAEADRERLRTAMRCATELRAPVTIEAGLLTPEGPSAVELSLSARFDERGRAAGLVLTGRSVAEIRQAYAELERSHDELKAAQALLVRNEKLASLGRLLAGVAHELNNPISFVYANAHALERYAGKFESYFHEVQAGATREDLMRLREDLKLDREVRNLREAVRGAREGAERVRDIVEDLRRLSSDGSGEAERFDLVAVTQVATAWVLRGARREVEVEMTGLPSLEVTGRPGHLQQVVMNLVQNALDAVEEVVAPKVVIDHATECDLAVLSVRDNGAGVPEGLEQAIFDPFFTTKPVGRGTGLGLPISHKIAEEHGGRLMLCEGGLGACFRLELPLDLVQA